MLSLALVAFLDSDLDRAEALAASALERVPPGVPQRNRALALLHLGRVDEAREVATQSLERYRHPELVELCGRHGIEARPGRSMRDTADAGGPGPDRRRLSRKSPIH